MAEKEKDFLRRIFGRGRRASVPKRKRGRPKGPKKIRLHALVLPRTIKEIDALVVKGQDGASSRGRIIDEKFKPQPK